MAETTGVNYSLGSGAINAVKEAGLGGDARKHLTDAAIAGGAMNIATDVKDQIVEKREDTAEGREAWDAGFDAMGDRGSWASGELFDQFQDLESGYRDKYVAAVQSGDIKAQQRMLKDQATRASGLDGWKKTMESAKQINDLPAEVGGTLGGWSNTFKRDKESLEIMNALTTLDGKSAVTKFGENGEMVFEIKLTGPPAKTVTKTRRQIDDMIAKGTKPLKLKDSMGKRLMKIKKDAEEGKSEWDEDRSYQEIVDSIDKNNVSHYFNENILGKTTFREDFMSEKNPVWSKPIPINSPELLALEPENLVGSKQDGVIDEMEWELMLGDENTRKLIMDEMERQPDIAKHYIADWVVKTEKQNVQQGQTKHNNDNLKEYYENLPNAKRKAEFEVENAEALKKAYDANF